MGNEIYFGEVDARRIDRLTDALEQLCSKLDQVSEKIKVKNDSRKNPRKI